MLALRSLLFVAGALLLATAVGITLYDLWIMIVYRRRLARGVEGLVEPERIR
jgi:hypothetical protein